MGNDVARDPPIPDCRKVIAGCPDAGRELLAEEVALAGEAFERDVAVAVVFVPDYVEIVQPTGDRQVGAPPVGDPLGFDKAAPLGPPGLVKAGDEPRLTRKPVEG